MAIASETRYLSCAQTASLVRAALKKHFPGVTFSVRSKTYSGGASIDVDWTDGPLTKEVEAVAKRYEGSEFDGMIDLKTHKSHYLRPDGEVWTRYNPGTEGSMGVLGAEDNRALAPMMPPDVQAVHFGADSIFCQRHISRYDAWYAEAVAWIYEHYHIEPNTGNPNFDRFGCEWVRSIANRMVYAHHEGEDWAKTGEKGK